MSIRNKLAYLAGMESLPSDAPQAKDLKTSIEQTQVVLTPTTSDTIESSKVTEAYLQQEIDREDALNDLQGAVEAMESLFANDYTEESLSTLMKHTERCASRAGYPVTLGVDGMEQLTPASVYLSVRSGLEALSEIDRNSAIRVEEGYHRLITICGDVEKRYDQLIDNLKLCMKKLKTNPSIKPDITLGEWNKWLNVPSKTPKSVTSLSNLMEIGYILNKVKVLEIASEDDSVSAKTQDALIKAIKKDIDVSRERTEDGKNHVTWEFRMNTTCVYFEFPNQNGTSLEALKVFNIRVQPFSDRFETKSKQVYRSSDEMVSELEEMISIAEDTKEDFSDWKKSLKTESGLVVSAIKSDKVEVAKALAYVSLHNRYMTGYQRGVYEILSAYEHLFRAHIS